MPEDRRRHGVILDMPVAANTTLAILRRDRRGRADRLRPRAAAGRRLRRAARRSRRRRSTTPVGNLSGGNQQKVALARWLATEPAVLILDEPTQGVDVGAKAEIHRLMGELAGRGLAILMISSELPEILGMSDRIAVMHGGTVVGTLDRAEATQETILELALGHTRVGKRGGRMSSSPISPRALGRRWPTRPAAARPGGRPPRGSSGPSSSATFVVSSAPVLVAAVGMTLVILCAADRHLDRLAVLASAASSPGCWPRPGCRCRSSALLTLLAGAVMGAVNGVLVAGLGLPSIVVTLATMVILREALRWWREGEFVRDLPRRLPVVRAGAGRRAVGWSSASRWRVFVAFAWGLRYLAAGRAVYATGSDPEAARLAGIRPRRVVFGVFVADGRAGRPGRAAQRGPVRRTSIRLAGDGPGTAGHRRRRRRRRGRSPAAAARWSAPLLGVALLGTIGPALVFLGAEA